MNNNRNDLSFSELRCKDVIDITGGKNLGHINDIIFSSGSAKIKGLVAPYGKKGLFSKGQEVFIPWNCVKNIGEDVIIVDISRVGSECGSHGNVIPPCHDFPQPCKNETDGCKPPELKSCVEISENGPNCDRRCDKCMLFDCQFRWKGKAL